MQDKLIEKNINIDEEIADFHRISLDKLYEKLKASENGLSTTEANKRLQQSGPNILIAKKQKSELIKFILQFKNYFAVLLIVGGGLALFAEQLDPNQGNLYIAYALFSVVLLNAIFTYVQERHNEKILQSFENMLPQMANVYRDGQIVNIKASEVVVGDVLLLNEGDKVCADARLIQQNKIKVNLSSLTGESEPQLRELNSLEAKLIDSRNMVLSGTLIESGNGLAIVCATGMQTQFGQIVDLTKNTDETETPIRKELTRFIRIIGLIAIVLGVSFFVASIIIGKGQIASLIFAIGIIVANVPEGLLPTVTLSLSLASKRMASKNALIKNLESVETLGSTTVICTDKTGTLTQNKISVVSLYLNQQEYLNDDLKRSSNKLNISQVGFKKIIEIMSLCNNAHKIKDGTTGDPTEVALLNFSFDYIQPEIIDHNHRVAEIPFDSSSKRMITINQYEENSSYQALLKGAPEIVLDNCTSYLMNDQIKAIDQPTRELFIKDIKKMAERGERLLAFAYKQLNSSELDSESDFVFVGLSGMLDPSRPEVPDAIKRCREAGIKLIMITGDYDVTAEAIARKIGLFTNAGIIILGQELESFSDEQLTNKLKEPEIVFARTSPEQKLKIVKALQAQGEVVCVTGDGVNDAPALKNADIGVAMGVIGTDVAKEASNMILMDDNFATIVSAVEEGRTIFENIKKFIAYILTSNVPEILPFIAYVVLDFPLALTVVLILAIDLGTDILPALGLGTEKPESDVMKRPPRARNERLLSRNMLIMSYGIVGMIQALAGFFSFFVVLLDGGWQWGESISMSDELYRTAVTAFFASIIICQIADVIICRTRRQSLLKVGLLSNKLVLLGILSELTLLALISYTPFFNQLFATEPLALWQVALSIPFAILIIVGDELRRKFVRNDNAFVLKWLNW